MRDEFEIIHLPRDKWEGALIPMRYTAEEYFDVSIENGRDHYSIKLNKCRFDVPVCHYPEEYDFPDRLYQQHWEKAFAWGIVRERGEGQEMVACIETCPEEWSNRLIVTELWSWGLCGVRHLSLGTWLTVPSLVEFSTRLPEQVSFNQNRLPFTAP